MLNTALTGGLMIVHLVSGYWVAVVIAGEAPSWPQAARVLLYILINMILAYEFVYKPAKDCNRSHANKHVVVVSLIPFCLGIACVIIVFVL
ncbi:MAG TPA: hypothetical protein EYN74_06145 [Nitrospirales bacterium]|nr:hypothetical protein [Nitrospirales bacterium]HIB53207.1 hypothetical protein [Nitrospirales bacterium]HIN33259.1 hypothetical protein [Nitrospirales bacterium]